MEAVFGGKDGSEGAEVASPRVAADPQDWGIFVLTSLVGLYFAANSNYFQVSTGILTTGRCGTQRISILMSIFFFYKHMTRYMDSGYVDASFQHGDNYEMIALLIFQFISFGDAVGGRRGGCGGRRDDHGFYADVGLSSLPEHLSTAGLRNFFELSGWFDML